MRVPGPTSVIDSDSSLVNASGMDLDDLFPGKPKDPLAELVKQDLDPLSVAELDERIVKLEAEIVRVRAKMDFAAAHRANAEDLFKSR